MTSRFTINWSLVAPIYSDVWLPPSLLDIYVPPNITLVIIHIAFIPIFIPLVLAADSIHAMAERPMPLIAASKAPDIVGLAENMLAVKYSSFSFLQEKEIYIDAYFTDQFYIPPTH